MSTRRIQAFSARIFPTAAIVLAALWVMSPVLSQCRTAVPIRPNNLSTVAIFNVWTIWWNADRIAAGGEDYWKAPIFAPETQAFGFSEPQPASVIVAPVIYATGSSILAYNIYLLIALLLNGASAYLVVRRHHINRLTATAVGVSLVWLPLCLRQLEVIQLVHVWPMIWTWDALQRHGRIPSIKTAVNLCAAYSITFYTCAHHSLFLTIVLFPTMWVLLEKIGTLRFWWTSIIATALTTLMVGMFALPMHEALKRDNFARSDGLVQSLSAKAKDLVYPPMDSWIGAPVHKNRGLSPGWIKVALALCGVVLGCCRRRRRRWVLFLAATVLCSCILALGSNLQIGSWQPWSWMQDWVPGISRVRNVFRFAFLSQIALVFLAAIGVHELGLRVRQRFGFRAHIVALCTVLLLAVFEVPAARPNVAGVPDLSKHTGWTNFIRENTAPGNAILCLPCAPGTKGRDFEVTVRWMYYGTLHRVPLLNGYSGFFPRRYLALRNNVMTHGMNGQILDECVDMGCQYLVVRHDFPVADAVISGRVAHGLQLVYEDPVGIRVFEILK